MFHLPRQARRCVIWQLIVPLWSHCRRAPHVAVRADDDARVLTEAAAHLVSDQARAAVLRLAGALAGTGIILVSPCESVSPRVAGEMLGVSRQFVDRMIKDGQLPATTKPGAAHQLVSVEDVRTLAARRERGHAAVDDLIGGLLADGADLGPHQRSGSHFD